MLHDTKSTMNIYSELLLHSGVHKPKQWNTYHVYVDYFLHIISIILRKNPQNIPKWVQQNQSAPWPSVQHSWPAIFQTEVLASLSSNTQAILLTRTVTVTLEQGEYYRQVVQMSNRVNKAKVLENFLS